MPQVALVTGGSSGIGFEIARQLGKTQHAAPAAAFNTRAHALVPRGWSLPANPHTGCSRFAVGYLPAAPG